MVMEGIGEREEKKGVVLKRIEKAVVLEGTR